MKKELHSIRYVFTEEEIKEKSAMLADACGQRSKIIEEKKAVASDFKSRIDQKDSTISRLSSNITNGFEYRSETCDVIMIPEKSIKQYWWRGVKYDERPMDPEDFQLKIEISQDGQKLGELEI